MGPCVVDTYPRINRPHGLLSHPDGRAIGMAAESPVRIQVGGDYHDGRLYFAKGSHVYGYTLPKP